VYFIPIFRIWQALFKAGEASFIINFAKQNKKPGPAALSRTDASKP